MQYWETRTIELIMDEKSNKEIISILSKEMDQTGVFVGDRFKDIRVNMIKQIIANVKDK